MNLDYKQKFVILSFVLILLVACASAAQFERDGTDRFAIDNPLNTDVGERIPVFLVMSDQPAGKMSLQAMKTAVKSQQAQVMNALAAIDPKAAETAQSYWLVNAIRVEADRADLGRLAALPGVDHIEYDYTATITDPAVEVMNEVDPQYISESGEQGGVVWSADFIEAPSVWETGNLGTGINISIVDTGIDGGHPAFGNRIVAWADFVNGQNATPYDDNGHGTHCAGTAAGGVVQTTNNNNDIIDVVLGVAPGANLMGAKVMNSQGSGSFSDIIAGAEWSAENGADIISMSLGAFFGPWYDDFTTTRTVGTLDADSSVNVSIEAAASYDTIWEPQFIVGAVYASDPLIIEEIENGGGNLTFTVTDASGNSATGSPIDWLGFDQPSGIYYFKAPYTDNAGAWNGYWKATLTNIGENAIDITKIRIAVCYQSNGQTVQDLAVNNLMNLGTTVIVSAGNSGEYGHGTIGSPGTAEYGITVGATDYMMDYRASFSSMGPVKASDPYIKPDVMAPGVGIISAYPGGYAIMDGTSMSAPAVAGTAALMLAGNSSLSSAEVKDALMSSAIHFDTEGNVLDTMQKNNVYGAGRVNAYEAVNTTGGLGNNPIGDGIIRELFGGIFSEDYSSYIYSNEMPVMAVAWNVTGSAPVVGETVKFSVRNDSGTPVYVNESVLTGSTGNASAVLDISGYSIGTLKLRITWRDHTIEQSVYKRDTPSPPSPPPDGFIYRYNGYTAAPESTVLIKYPLLNPDGTPYTQAVNLKIQNYTTTIYNATHTPTAGVVGVDLNLSTISGIVNNSEYNIDLDEERVGYLWIGDTCEYYELWPSPVRAICPPGSSIDISTTLTAGHGFAGQKTGSTTATAMVITFSETEINSLSDASRTAILGGDVSTLADLENRIAGMDVNRTEETFQITNGIGVYNLNMPVDSYLAMVYFSTPLTYDYELGTLVYGKMTSWMSHRTTGSTHWLPDEATIIYQTSSDWSATWDQTNYTTIPSDEATVEFTVYNYSCDESTNIWYGEAQAGKTVYLYTKDGVQTATTGANGACNFTLTPGDAESAYEYLALTGGQDVWGNIYSRGGPLSPALYSRISADLITIAPQTPQYHSWIRPDTATRSISVTADNATRDIRIASYGPNNEAIKERAMFAFDQIADWNSLGTWDAATVEFDGTHTETVTIPGTGDYKAQYDLLNPTTGRLSGYSTSFTDTSYNLTYEIGANVLEGESVPVTFTLTDHNGDPVSNAKVLFGVGAAANWWDWLGSQAYEDPRYENVWTYLGYYPDPYSEVHTGYTDSSGQVILTFVAPTHAQQDYRLALGTYASVNYGVICVHDDHIVAAGWSSFMPAAGALPDFTPSVDAPNIVKINRDNIIRVEGVTLYVTNIGTADFIYSGTSVQVIAEVGSHTETTEFDWDITMGEKSEILTVSIEESASSWDIDPETTSLPQDTTIKVTVNPETRRVVELRYDNNEINHNLRITAPDLVTEILAPARTTQFVETPIGVKIRNAGEVASVATTLNYDITGTPAETGIAIPGLNPGESTLVWRNATLVPGTYVVTAEVNPDHLTDYETSYTNNEDVKEIVSYAQAETTIEMPQDEVYIPGTRIEIPVIVKGVEDLAAYQMTFTYNASVINVTNVVAGDIALTAKNLQAGSAIFNGAQTSGVSGDVTVATLQVDVIGSSGDTTDLDLLAQLWDINGFVIPVDVTDGSATLMLYGDANDDGTVNQADTLKVLRWMVGLDTGKPTSGTRLLQTDVTRNSVVDVGDGMFIAQYNAGLRDDYFRIR